MSEKDSEALVLRHWRAVIVGVLLTACLAAAAFLLIPAQYEAKALIVLLPATAAGAEDGGGNPYTELGGLDTAAGVLALAMNTDRVADAVAATTPSATFTVEEDETTSGPVLLLTAEDDDPETTLQALDTLVDQAGPTLARLQQEAGAPRDTLITMAVVTREASASVVRQSQIRSVLGAAVLGMALTGVAVVGLERRGRTRSRETASADTPDRTPTSGLPPAGAASTGPPAPPAGVRGPLPTPHPRNPSPGRRHPSPRPRALPTDGSGTVEPATIASTAVEPTTAIPVAAAPVAVTMPIAALTRVGHPVPGSDGAPEQRSNGEGPTRGGARSADVPPRE